MNFGEMKRQLASKVRDSRLASEFPLMINDAILQIASDYDLPSLQLIEPCPFPVNSSDWNYPLPANYHKKIFRAFNSSDRKVWVYARTEDLERLDFLHKNTGSVVTHLSANDSGDEKWLYTYPMADDTLRLWYYRLPELLVKDVDACTCIPAAYHERVIFPKVIIKNFELLMDQVENFDNKPLAYWEGRLASGVFGSRSQGPGLMHWISQRKGGPRRRGGRDPVGVGDYTRW